MSMAREAGRQAAHTLIESQRLHMMGFLSNDRTQILFTGEGDDDAQRFASAPPVDEVDGEGATSEEQESESTSAY